MTFLYYALFAIAIAVVDQVTKYWVVQSIPLYHRMEFLPGVLCLTYVRNDGAAFSSFRGMQWMFVLIFVLFTGLVLYEYFRRPMPFTKLERWCIAAIYGGGVGNMLDRVRLGYVVDMVETEFIDFPIFNVADCFITCGCVLLVLHIMFCNKQIWKEEKK